MKRIYRVYADTSVFGGVFDEEFADASSAFFDRVRSGRFQLVTSALVQDEMVSAPSGVRDLFDKMVEIAEVTEVSDEALMLQQAYISSGIVSERWSDDALHVALATVSRCSLLVSWNFRHIVHFEKVPLYNAVNKLNRHGEIAIHTPLEVIGDEEKEAL